MRTFLFLLLFIPHWHFERQGLPKKLVQQARAGDTTALVTLGNARYEGSLVYGKKLYNVKCDPFEALRLFRKADSLGSKEAKRHLGFITTDSTIKLNVNGNMLWHFRENTLALTDGVFSLDDAYCRSQLRFIYEQVDTLIIQNPNNILYRDNPQVRRLPKADLSPFANVKTIVFFGNDSDGIDELPESFYKLSQLSRVYFENIDLAPGLRKELHHRLPGLEIVELKTLDYGWRHLERLCFGGCH